MRDYVEVTYGDKPVGDYPGRLTAWLVHHYGIPKGSFIVDAGCGRGEYTDGFNRCDMRTTAADKSQYYPAALVMDFDAEGITLPPDMADVVFIKSVLEHLRYPEKLMADAYRVLRSWGRAIIISPDWRVGWRGWYDDYTHYSPMTVNGIRDMLRVTGFNDVQSEPWVSTMMACEHPWTVPIFKALHWLMPRCEVPAVKYGGGGMILATGVK